MRAIDTNIIVRYLTGDDLNQAARARAAVDGGPVFVSRTVLLECDWVLRGVYEYTRREVADTLRAFAGLPGVFVEAPTLLARALDLAESGMDFADALHLCAATECDVRLTFNRWFIRLARGTSTTVLEP